MGKISRGLLSFVSLSFFVLTLASARSQKARYHLNTILYMIGIGVCSAFGVAMSLVLSLVPGQRFNTNYLVARSFYTYVSTFIGVKFKIEGAENLKTRPAILAGNHQSTFDTAYLGAMFPLRSIVLAKRELKWIPLLGQFMWLSGDAFIDRKSRESAIRTMTQIGVHIRKNDLALFAFPEGTRSYFAVPDLLPFKKGVFHLAIQTQLPIVPIVCENYYRLVDNRSRFEPGEVRIAALPPIETTGMVAGDTDKLIEIVRSRMLAQLKRFDAERDEADIQAATHPTSRPAPRMGGLAGLAACLVGTGRAAHARRLDRIARENVHNPGTSGERPSDYNLVSQSEKLSAEQERTTEQLVGTADGSAALAANTQS